MANIIDNYKPYDADWNFYNLFELVDKDELIHLEKVFIEISLYTEIYIRAYGLAPIDENKEQLKNIIKKCNPSLAEEGEVREKQVEEIYGIYKSHYIAVSKNAALLTNPYLLVAYINRLDFSFKPAYISALFRKKQGEMNNIRFKKPSFDKAVKTLLGYWTEETDLRFDFLDIYTKYEVIKTIIGAQGLRGFKKDNYYE